MIDQTVGYFYDRDTKTIYEAIRWRNGMDYQQLESYLKEYDQEEMIYKEQDNPYSDYSTFPTVMIHGKAIPLMTHVDLSLKADTTKENNNLIISKHPRFITTTTHIHEWIEISYVYSGTIHETIDQKEYILEAGQLCIVDTQTPHSIQRAKEHDLMINILVRKEYFSTFFLSRFSSQNAVTDFILHAISKTTENNSFIIFPSQDDRRLKVFIQEMVCEYLEPSLNHEDFLDNCMTMIFLELIEVHNKQLQDDKLTSKKTSVLAILQYMEMRYTTCSLESTAQHFHLNPSYLSTLLKQELHTSYKETLQKIRLTHACQLLKTTDLTITEVSNAVGYENISFFYRKFKEAYQCLPDSYRHSN